MTHRYFLNILFDTNLRHFGKKIEYLSEDLTRYICCVFRVYFHDHHHHEYDDPGNGTLPRQSCSRPSLPPPPPITKPELSFRSTNLCCLFPQMVQTGLPILSIEARWHTASWGPQSTWRSNRMVQRRHHMDALLHTQAWKSPTSFCTVS